MLSSECRVSLAHMPRASSSAWTLPALLMLAACEDIVPFPPGSGMDAAAEDAALRGDGGEADGGTTSSTGEDASVPPVDAAHLDDVGADSSTHVTCDAGGPCDADAQLGRGTLDDGGSSGPGSVAAACGQLQKEGPVLLELGRPVLETPTQILVSGDRMLTHELIGDGPPQYRWRLWDATQWTVLAESARTCDVFCPSAGALEGESLIVPGTAGLEIRASSDGRLLGTVPNALSFGLASGGGYVWTASDDTLETWSLAGTRLASHSYQQGAIFAGPTDLFVGSASGEVTTIERISPVTGESYSTTFPGGSFIDWFSDGSRFFVRESSGELAVYSTSNGRERVFPAPALPNRLSGYQLGGWGDYYWIARTGKFDNPDAPYNHFFDTAVELFSVSRPDVGVLASGSSRILFDYSATETFYGPISASSGVLHLTDRALDLRGASPREVWPPNAGSRVLALTASGATLAQGEVTDIKRVGDTSWTPLNCGAVKQIIDGNNGIWAIGLSEQILLVRMANRELLQVIPGFAQLPTALHASDSKLVVRTRSGPELYYSGPTLFSGVRSYEVATGALLTELVPPSDPAVTIKHVEVARDAARVVQQRWRGNNETHEYVITDLEGRITYASSRTSPHTIGGGEITLQHAWPFTISPSGQRLAVVRENNYSSGWNESELFGDDGASLGTFRGAARGWLDDDRLVVDVIRSAGEPGEFQQDTHLYRADGSRDNSFATPAPLRFESDGDVINVDAVTREVTPPFFAGRVNDAFVVYATRERVKVLAR